MDTEIRSPEIHLNKLADPTEKISLNSYNDDTGDKGRSRRYAFVRRYLMYIILFVVICIGISIILIVNEPSSANICPSDECLRSAAALKQSMNFRVDPCDDFYEYVCGNWAEERAESDQGNSWFRERQVKIYRNIRAQLEKDVKRFDPKPVTQAKIMYHSCLIAGKRKAEAIEDIAQTLQEFGLPTIPSLLNQGEPNNFDWVATLARIQRKLGLDILIGFEVITDAKHSNQSQIWLMYRNPLSSIEKMIPGVDDNETRNATIFAEILSKMVEEINVGFNSTMYESNFVSTSEKYFKFLNDLPTDSTMENDQENDVFLYTVQELQRITDSYVASNEPIWKHYFEELFAPFPGAQPTSEDRLIMYKQDLNCLKKLVKIMSQQRPQIIELYIWHRVARYLTFHAFEQKKSKEICAMNVQKHLAFAVSYLISSENFLTSVKPRIEEMLDNIRGQFNQMVMETDWMDSKTKNAMLEKSTTMRSNIGFPRWILDIEKLEQYFDGLQITKQNYIKNMLNAIEFFRKNMLQNWRTNHGNQLDVGPTDVNALYSNQQNAMYIPVAFIQYPYYYLGLEAMNYGAIGIVLGHELTHGFDDTGRFFDKSGNKKSWWSTRTHEEYETRANCMVEQYNGYSLPEGSVNGTLTLSENIADNGGLRESLRAYRAYVQRHGPEPALPGFDGFSHDQLFFISFANLWCSTSTPTEAKMLLRDSHSPGKVRVKGTVSNMPEFSEAFQCAPGKAMNPERKCRVW